MGYRKSKFGDNPLYKILSDHWQNFLDAYEHRFQRACGALRFVACDVVKRFLDCGNPMNGFARIKCESCGFEKLMYFSCKTRGFCPSCQARRAEEWARWLADNLSEPVPHHQIVFTIPKMLRPYFRYDRKLITNLSRAARTSVVKFMEQELGEEVTPAMVVVKHTYGEGDKEALTRVARYMMRSPVVISRLTYHREAQQVRIKKRNPASGDEIVMDVLDFIARLSVQIPDPHERIVLYYGLYSNASGGRRTTQDEKELKPPATGFSRSGESEYSKSRRIRWAKLIAKVWKEDPHLCTSPLC